MRRPSVPCRPEKYSNRRSRPRHDWAYSPHGMGRRLLGHAAAGHVGEGIDVAGRQSDDPRTAKDVGDHGRHQRVHRPGEFQVAARAELAPGHENHVGKLGKRRHRMALQQITLDGLDAPALEFLIEPGLGKPRHADDAALRQGAPREPRQGRPHLAADPEDHDVAVGGGEIGGQVRPRAAHEFLERVHVREAFGQGILASQFPGSSTISYRPSLSWWPGRVQPPANAGIPANLTWRRARS